MKLSHTVAIAITVTFIGAACSKAKTDSATAPTPAPQAQLAAATKSAFDFPEMSSIAARPAEFVLAPSKEAVAEGADAVYIYYAAKLVEKGPKESKIKTLPGDEISIPNTFIIPLGGQQAAKPGDIVLTWWQSGSGMQRAIVTGGSPNEPEVMYLDLDYKSDAKPEKLQAGTFFVLPSSSTVGNVVACLDSGDRVRYQIVASADSKYLVLGWAGKMRAVNKSDCTGLPHDAGAKPGDIVQVPVFSKYQPATVTKVDPKNGRVFAKYKFGSGDEEKPFAFGEVTKGF